MRILSLFILCVATMSESLSAEESIVFVSAFKAGDEGAIHAFRFDSKNGHLKLLHRTTDVENPFFIAVSPNRQFLYSIEAKQFGSKDNEFVVAYKIEGQDGKLTRLNRQTSLGTASCYLDVDATGKSVVVANYSSGSVAALQVLANGSLGEIASFVQHTGSSVNPERQKEPHAHCIVISPDNRFVLAADLGIDKILNYKLTPGTGELKPNVAQAYAELPPGSGPRHLVFHINGQRVYVINELKNTVTCFDYATQTGLLTQRQTVSTVPEDFAGVSHTADLKITPDGRFLYGTNRGHDSIAIFRIADDGHLSLLKIEPSLGKGPQNLLITPDGRWLLCANMPGNNLAVFSIDASNGALKSVGDPVTIPMPSCIRWLE
jgi:6-phosphogluconolactonase